MAKKISRERGDAIVNDLRRGEFDTYSELAEKHGVSGGTILHYRRKFDISTRPGWRIPQERIDAIVNDLRRGEFDTYSELAEKHGVSRLIIENCRQKLNINISARPKINAKTAKIIHFLETTKRTHKSIADELGVSQQWVSQVMSKYNARRPAEARGVVTSEQKEKILSLLLKQDITLEDVAERAGVSCYQVRKIQQEEGFIGEKEKGYCPNCEQHLHGRFFRGDSELCTRCEKPEQVKMADDETVKERLRRVRDFCQL